MAALFETTDPRGRKVILTEEVWQGHILWQRAFMEGWEDEVKRAIEHPSLGIFADAHIPNREVYYLRRRSGVDLLKVVVDFSGDVGIVVTAHPRNKPKPGERMLWPISSR